MIIHSTLQMHTTLFAVLLAAAANANAATIVNPWSGVIGDRGNITAFAFRADAGNFPTSVTPTGALTPTISLDSITLIRPNDATTPNFGTGANQTTTTTTPVFLDIYTSMGAANAFSGYVGSSSTSIAWSSTTADQAYTLSFTGTTLSSTTKYWFVFSEDSVAGDVANFRAKLNTSGSDPVAGPGQGYLVGDTAQAALPTNNTQNWGTAFTVDFTAVPEPSAALLGGLGVLTLLRRRRA
jgi:hypothetical protein